MKDRRNPVIGFKLRETFIHLITSRPRDRRKRKTVNWKEKDKTKSSVFIYYYVSESGRRIQVSKPVSEIIN